MLSKKHPFTNILWDSCATTNDSFYKVYHTKFFTSGMNLEMTQFFSYVLIDFKLKLSFKVNCTIQFGVIMLL